MTVHLLNVLAVELPCASSPATLSVRKTPQNQCSTQWHHLAVQCPCSGREAAVPCHRCAERSSLQAQTLLWQSEGRGHRDRVGGSGTRGAGGPWAGAMGTSRLLAAATGTRARDEPLAPLIPRGDAWSGGGDGMEQRKPRSASVRGHEGATSEVTETCACPPVLHGLSIV